MPKYLFTSDLRISELPNRIKSIAAKIQSGEDISSIENKSDNNNAATLAFYFNLYSNTQICKEAAVDPKDAIRNYTIKFQFPNVRTPESFNDSINERSLFAPYRAIVKVLYNLADLSNGIGSLSKYQILYYFFCNKDVYTNPKFDTDALISRIASNNIDLEDKVQSIISWNQYDRQSREFLKVLTYASRCFNFTNDTLSLNKNHPDYIVDREYIEQLCNYEYLWYPSDATSFSLSKSEYISFMDTAQIPFNVISINGLQSTYHRYESDGKVTPALLSLLTAIRTKPFILLAGISGTGKSRIVRKLAQATDTIGQYADDAARFACHKPENFCLIQVKPNWHNSMDVVGYKSNIGKNGEHYEYTDFIDFIAKAWQHPEVPFFLCLDEMNLAPVEEYFAEFLSAIESRSIGANGEYETDPIIKPFKDFGDKVAIEMINHLLGTGYVDTGDFSPLAVRFYLKGMTLPRNLIVMGTVNMDETTFSFSRKVLDRAMSMEMNEVSYDDFLIGKTEDDIPLLTDYNSSLVDRPISAQEVKLALGKDAEKVISFLKAVNAILEGTPFKLGYRAANEAMLYAAAAQHFGTEDVNASLDDFTLMKILSRIEGDDSKLVTHDGNDLLAKLMELFDAQFGSERTSKSQLKLQQMINTKSRDHFVSFWG